MKAISEHSLAGARTIQRFLVLQTAAAFCIRGASELRNVPKSGKSSKGEGDQHGKSKSPKHPGGWGAGQENYGLFPLFGTFLNSEASLKLTHLNFT